MRLGLFLSIIISIFAGKQVVKASCHRVCCLVFEGNRQTKVEVIQRELLFKQGDTLCFPRDSALIESSRYRIISLRLFNVVEVKPLVLPNGNLEIKISVVEKWFIWPRPILYQPDRNLNVWWQQRDLKRLNYGVQVKIANLSGQNDVMRIQVQTGYSRKLQANYQRPWIGKTQQWGFEFDFQFQQAKEIWLETQNDQLRFFQWDNEVLFNTIQGAMGVRYRKKMFWRQECFLSFERVQVGDTVLKLNKSFINGLSQQNSWLLSASVIYDSRDTRDYALLGRYLKMEIQPRWIPTSGQTFAFLQGWLQQYQRWGKRWAFGALLRGRYVLGKGQLPYYWNRALGYNDQLRGFEYQVVDGKHFFMAKSTIKYELIKERSDKIPYFPFKNYARVPWKTFVTVFAETGKVSAESALPMNSLPGKWLASIGTGIDAVFYYDKVMSINLTYNSSKAWGVYMHLRNPF